MKGTGPVVSVKTVPLETGNISEDITVYGKVIPAPGATQAVSVPFQSHVRHVMVNNGQKVSRGDVLLKIGPSPDTRLQFSQAYASYESTKQALQNMQERFDLKLATNDQLLKAKLAFEQAQLRLESMKHQGIEGEQDIWADVGGLIKKVYVEEGAIVPAGNPLVEIVAQNRLEVRLGVETEDIGKVQPKQSVLLTQVNVSKSPAVSGQIRQISYAVNPSTRLVDVFVTLPLSAGFVLGESVLGKIAVSSSRGLIVPRSAVLPEGDTYILFTVKNGRGVKHVVQLGLQSEKEVEVIGTGLQPGEPVVILGNYELKDGMAAKVEDPQ
jgi:membrane fusion protein (multidrug efflux system)